MKIKNKVLKSDFTDCLNCNFIDWDLFRNKSLLITGATGFIGSLLVKILLFVNSKLNLNITVYALCRNSDKANKIYEEFLEESALHFVVCDLLLEEFNFTVPVNYIVHAASITTSKIMVQKPVDVILTAVEGTRKLLNYAKDIKVKKFLYISSMEMYGNMHKDGFTYEQDLGYLDLSNIRSCYPESKRLCEVLCNAYVKQYGVNACCARLAQTFGAGILPGENRVFAQIARAAMNEENILLHTKGLSEGNYVYSTDAIKAILLILLRGIPGNAYNVVNERNHMTISEMANLVASVIAKGKIKVLFDIPNNGNTYGYAQDVKLNLSSKKLQSLNWMPQYNLETMFKKTIEYLKVEYNN